MAARYSKIAGVGGHLPERTVSNDDISAALDTSDDWIFSRTGIRRRRIAADGELASDLAVPAAKAALSQAGLAAGDIDLIVFATTTPDCVYPATACILQDKLGAAKCAAFDIQAVCSGFVYALTVGDALIKAGRARRALIVGGEVYSHILDWQDRATAVLFGDGAGAAVLTDSIEPGIISAVIRADGAHRDKLQTPGHIKGGALSEAPYTRMDGGAVFRFAVSAMANAAAAAAAEAGLDLAAVDWFVPHQANARIMDATARKLAIAPEKIISTVGEHANTSAASIPLALASACGGASGQKRIAPGDLVLMTTVGGGFTWGAMLARW